MLTLITYVFIPRCQILLVGRMKTHNSVLDNGTTI